MIQKCVSCVTPSPFEYAIFHFTAYPIHYHIRSPCTMSSTLPPTASSQPIPSKRYPYERPRRATTRPTPKAALYGALQPKKRGNNFSLGSRQTPRNVSTCKPKPQAIDAPLDTEKTASPTINIDPVLASPLRQETAIVPLKLPRVKGSLVDPRTFCFGRLSEVVSLQMRLMATD